ncbi:DsbA family oxidoreductase [Leucobacter sp. UT-8R-CII-1-4]|uniref:DsbA family oxidoreductase n=1 Tax=Leucobacter sp. UT-8R-CII-1-4 TaxID=3040075 RepID=UPI0024A80752|nr:DsbA family oxidoreductase [Leucobacter sp. UT-8R-CII-1-4]MDI6022012.1 DsbA family oxidoreductase [Leucobacter sp. UT-8R-CII-1-4]
MNDTLRVDIWSDIACPWCYIGKRRFEAGVAEFTRQNPEIDIEVESHSFELAPDTPDNYEGSEIDFLTKHKGMPREQVEQMLEQMTKMAELEGIEFNFDKLRHANTSRAHRVLHLAKSQGLQAEMQDRLFRAYFSEGRQVSDVETLAELGEEVGLDADEVRDAYNDETFEDAVERDITRARMLGVNGVPYFLFEEKYAVSGAQSAETFANVLEQVQSFRNGESSPED